MAITFSRDRYKLWYNTSPYHNVPMVNNIAQEARGEAKATQVKFQTTSAKTLFSMELAHAYPAAAGIGSWIRRVEVDELGNSIEVKDGYQLQTAPAEVAQTLMTVCETDIDTPGKIVFTTDSHRKVQMQYDATLWKVTRERMQLTEPHEQGLKANWNNRSIWRLRLTQTTAGKSGSHVFRFTK
eukprot:TRINITY_DN44501_c0_g1_i1.p1 TRINITY_DN44501_c0_g1~~TRINITY_DN44501_c0_g1_i1.p1  ORF type:complete len:211 (+),score=19.35 TRINITY_DN44501_c0_g1_i1:85-633(+)